MDLSLSASALTVDTTLWDPETPCIVLVYDGINDHRTPALTAAEARSIAADLLEAANDLDDRRLDNDTSEPADELTERRVNAVIERAKQDPALWDRLVHQYVHGAISEVFAKDVISGRVIHNIETDELCLASNASDEFRAEAVAAYQRRFGRSAPEPVV